MTQEEGMELLNAIKAAEMKTRSITAETAHDGEDLAGTISQWSYDGNGESAILKAIMAVENKGRIEGLDLYNIVYMANQNDLIGISMAMNGVELPRHHNLSTIFFPLE